MASQGPSRVRPGRRTLTLAAAGIAGAAVLERRHLRGIAADPEFLALSAPLGGETLRGVRSADGTRLNVRVLGGSAAGGDGAGAPTLVLAHGWTEQLSWWGPVIRRLAGPELRIVAFDLRGHGDSDPAAGDDYSMPRFGEDVEAVLTAARGGREPSAADAARTALAGHSLGAMSIATWAAAVEVAPRVGAVALVNLGLSDLIGGALLFGQLGAWLARPAVGRALLGSRRPLLPVSTPLSMAGARYAAFGPDASDGAVAFYERMLLDCDPRSRAATGIALSTLELLDAVPRITVPTLVVAGDSDRLTPVAHARRIAAALPDGAGLLELERTGHMTALERPDRLADAIAGLLHETGVTTTPAATAAA